MLLYINFILFIKFWIKKVEMRDESFNSNVSGSKV